MHATNFEITKRLDSREYEWAAIYRVAPQKNIQCSSRLKYIIFFNKPVLDKYLHVVTKRVEFNC